MRHPLLRILAALLIGLWSPVCCCRASSMVGGGCGVAMVVAAPADEAGCSDGCCGDREPAAPQSPEPDNHERGGDRCPACPSCLGPLGDAGLVNHAKANVEFGLSLLCMVVYARATPWAVEAGAVEPIRPAWSAPTKSLRANRAALRWHCALIV